LFTQDPGDRAGCDQLSVSSQLFAALPREESSSDNVVHKFLDTEQPEPAVTEKPARLTLTATLLSFVAKLMSGASIRWLDIQPDTCQRVYFANHTSHLDAVVLWSSLPRNVRALTRPVAARDYWDKNAFRRHIAGSLNALLIDRQNIKVHRSPVEMMIQAIGNTHSLIVFPEGGRNTNDEMGEFKSGLYYLSKKRPDLELVPVYVDNLNRVLPRGEFLPVPLLSCITIGPPMWLESKEKKNDFLARAREAVLRLKDV
jgi:1-acyl-sn-glycerol-3-phosphate acyltransferase